MKNVTDPFERNNEVNEKGPTTAWFIQITAQRFDCPNCTC